MRRRTLVLVLVVLAVLGTAAAVWATRGSDCRQTTLSVSDPGSPKTMKVYRKSC